MHKISVPLHMRKRLLATLLLLVINANIYSQNCSINAGLGNTICQNDSMTLNGTRSGLFASGAVVNWSQVSGPSVIIHSPNTLITAVSGYGSGDYVFRLSIKCRDGYIAEDFVTITVLPLTTPNAGQDTVFCPNATSTLYANLPLHAGEIGKWTFVGSNAAGISIAEIHNPRSPISINPNNAGTSILRWTITTVNGCTSSDDVSITNFGGVAPVFAGDDQILGNCFSASSCANLLASNGGRGLGGQNGTWTFVSGPSVPAITQPNSPGTRVCDLVEGTYVFRYTVTGPCVSGYDEVHIVVPPPGQASTVANSNSFSTETKYCGLVNSITLRGNAPLYAGETVRWTQTAGSPLTIATPDNPSTLVTGITEYGTYCFNYKIQNTSSGCSSNNLVCYSFFEQGSVNGGPDQILPCDVTSTIIPATTTGAGTLNYRIISGPSGAFSSYPTGYGLFNDINGLKLPGTYRVEVNYSFGMGCPAVSDFVDVTVSRTPTGTNAGTDLYFACSSPTAQLAGNNPVLTGLGNGRWSQVAGPVSSTIVSPVNYITDIRGLIPGEYTFRWTVRGGNNCPSNSDDVKVFIPDTLITNANAGADNTVCYNSPIILHGNGLHADETALWVSQPAGVIFSPGNTVPSPTLSGLQPATTYSFTYTINNSCGAVSKDTVKITTSASSGPSVANAGADQCLPEGTSTIQLNAVRPVSGSGVWYQIEGAPVLIADRSTHITSVSGAANGTYKFLWTVSVLGCSNSTTDTVVITISANTTAANAGTDATICSDEYTLLGNNPAYGTGVWTQISGDGDALLSNPDNPVCGVTNLTTGIYTFRWTIRNGVCPYTSDEVTLTASSPPSMANAGSDQVLCGVNANTAQLNAQPPLIGTGQWVQVTGPNIARITSNTFTQTTVTGLTNGSYTFRWIVAGGPSCSPSTDDVVINISIPANAGPDQNLCNLPSATLRANTGSAGVWSQISGPLAVISQSPANNPIASISGLLPGSVYIFRYTIPASYGCPETVDEVIIYNRTSTQIPNAGPDSAYCNVTSFRLNGSTPANGETGTWSVLSGPSGAQFYPNVNTPDAVLTNTVPGTYTLKWTLSNGTCSSSDLKRIDNYALPTMAAAGADQMVCFGNAILQGNVPLNGIGRWSQVSGPASVSISSVNNPVSEVRGLDMFGTYIMVWTISNGSACSPSRDTVKLTVSALAPSVSNAGADQHLCQQDATILSANLPAVGTGTWTQIAGPDADITSEHAPISTVGSLVPGTYKFVWTVVNTDASCFSKDTVTINNNSTPNAANAGNDEKFCVFGNVSLSANSPVTGTTGSWSFVSGPNTPFIISPAQPNSPVAGVVPGIYSFRWTISSPNCPPSSDEVLITVISAADLAIAGSNQQICSSTSTLYANAPTHSNQGIWEQADGPGDVTFSSISSPVCQLSDLIPGEYKLVWKIYNEECFTTDTLTVTVEPPGIVNAGPDNSLCNKIPEYTLSASFLGGSAVTAVWSIVSGSGSLSNILPTNFPNLVSFLPDSGYTGAVILRLTSNDACLDSVSDEMVLNMMPSVVSPLVAVNDVVHMSSLSGITIPVLENDKNSNTDILLLCKEDAITFPPSNGTVSVLDDGSLVYTPGGYFKADSFQYQICSAYFADSLFINGCPNEGKGSAWVFILMDECVIPNTFTPNGDGINDVFSIPCVRNKTEFSVYNIWGVELYSSENYLNDWDGNYNGAPLPEGTYYYSFRYRNLDNDEYNKAGFISLRR
ncbi:MAG: gliding motility-associated C-terminal domain-containing protein [Sphingobacteriales bacterium]|nr:gliding motility-associated C-terminal domain-containing protein [Sphingobacteriales bacterium]